MFIVSNTVQLFNKHKILIALSIDNSLCVNVIYLQVAKLLTVLGAFVMSAVSVGVAVQIVEENMPQANTTLPSKYYIPLNLFCANVLS